jgi:hypothetical protein
VNTLIVSRRAGGHAAHRRFPWLRRTPKAAKPVVTAVHGATLAEPMRTDVIITAGRAVPAPALVERTEPVAVKTTTTRPDGTPNGYDTQPFSITDEPEQPQRIPGSSGLQPLVPVKPLGDVDLLGRVRDGIRDLEGAPVDEAVARPGAFIRFRPADEPEPPQDPLNGAPAFLGVAVVDGLPYAGLSLGGHADGNWIVDESSPARLTDLCLAAIQAIPELSSDPSFLEQVIYAAQIKLEKLTNGGPVVEQQDGAQATGGAA